MSFCSRHCVADGVPFTRQACGRSRFRHEYDGLDWKFAVWYRLGQLSGSSFDWCILEMKHANQVALYTYSFCLFPTRERGSEARNQVEEQQVPDRPPQLGQDSQEYRAGSRMAATARHVRWELGNTEGNFQKGFFSQDRHHLVPRHQTARFTPLVHSPAYHRTEIFYVWTKGYHCFRWRCCSWQGVTCSTTTPGSCGWRLSKACCLLMPFTRYPARLRQSAQRATPAAWVAATELCNNNTSSASMSMSGLMRIFQVWPQSQAHDYNIYSWEQGAFGSQLASSTPLLVEADDSACIFTPSHHACLPCWNCLAHDVNLPLAILCLCC